MSKTEFLRDALEARSQLERQPIDPKVQQFLVEAARKDRDKGFASDLMSADQLDAIFGIGKWKPMPTFEILQESGKRRCITDGSRYGHNAATSFPETMMYVQPCSQDDISWRW